VQGDQQPAAKLLEQHPAVEKIETQGGVMIVTLREGATDYTDFAGVLLSSGFKLTMLREEEINLETAFMALTKGITA
jgi:ABC-2 type transport system ATP-binding protein